MFVFAGLWILDAYTTMIGMSRGGREEAPLSALEIADFGIGWYVELKVVVCVMAVLGTMVVAWRWRTLRPFYALLSISFALAVLVLTGIAVLNNTIQLNWI